VLIAFTKGFPEIEPGDWLVTLA